MLLKYDMRDRQSCTKRVIEKLKRVVQRARQATVGEMSGKEKKGQKVEMTKKNKKGEIGGGWGEESTLPQTRRNRSMDKNVVNCT